MVAALFVLACAVQAQAPVVVDVAFQPAVGLTDAEFTSAKAKLGDELSALGVTTKEAPQVDPGCVPDVACVEKARADGNAAALLVVEMVRVGPVVQLTATGAASDATSATGTHGLEEKQLATGPLLPENVRAWATSLAAAAPKVVAPPKDETPPPAAPPSASFTPMQSVGLFTGGAGVIVLVAGTVCIAAAEPTLEDKNSLGAQKSQASVLGWTGVAATAIGAAAVGAGAIVFFVGGD